MPPAQGWEQPDLTKDALFKPNPTSRITNFSPFRRAQSSNLANAKGTDGYQIGGSSAYKGGIGDVSEVPSVSKAPTKPPKPAGLRVKKAKALSISLLTGNGAGSSTQDPLFNKDVGSTSMADKRQSRLISSGLPRIQQQFAPAEGLETLPARAQSAMDHYKEHGPSKGLASRDWSDLDTIGSDRVFSKKKKLSDWDRERENSRDQSDELFIIGKGQAGASTSGAVNQQVPLPSVSEPEAASRPSMDYRRGGLRRLRNEIQQPKTMDTGAPSLNDLQSSQTTRLDDPQSLGKKGSSVEGDQNPSSPSANGNNQDSDKRSHQPASSASAAIPFLNPYTAQANLGSYQSSSSGRKRSTPAPLGRSAIVRSSYLTSFEKGPTSAPIISSSASSPTSSKGSEGRHGHNRTTSDAMAKQQTPSSIPQLATGYRSRTQSYVGLSPVAVHESTTPIPSDNKVSKSSTSPLPPPRHKHSKTAVSDTFLRVPGVRNDEDNFVHPRSSSPFGQSVTLQSLGQQIGGMGAAVGRRGWDMMKSWNSGASLPTSPISATGSRALNTSALNEATRAWIAFPDPTSSTPSRGQGLKSPGNSGAGTVFGCPLREAVIKTRLARKSGKIGGSEAQLSALDLGSEFSIHLPELDPERWNRQTKRKAVDRLTARRQYLPAVVVRCIESIEKWGVEEEGIYRLSGRSSHTAKLKAIFDNTRPVSDLQLLDIGPAELDLNSVCSLLKAYLRALPDLLLTNALAKDFNQAVQEICGMSAVSEVSNINHNRERVIREQHEKEANHSTSPSSPGLLSQKIANAIQPLMSKLPAENWYLLREIALHLGDLTTEESIRQTKMPLSNLCLVLAPTLSLSVAMVRVLVESREQLFDQTCPLADSELDNIAPEATTPGPIKNSSSNTKERSRLPLPRQSSRLTESDNRKTIVGGPQLDAKLPSTRLSILDTEDWDGKRASVATVKPSILDIDKRKSSSSITTLQERNRHVSTSRDHPPLPTRLASSSTMRPTSEIFGLSGFAMSGTDSSLHRQFEGDDDDDENNTPPIAAQFIRKRSSSIANSIGSAHSSTFSVTPLKITKAPSSTSLYSNTLQGSTMDSSVTSLPDRDSPKTADEDWHGSVSNTPTLSTSNSNGSQTSLHKGSSGALDRPRPPTSNSARFFSSRSGKNESKASLDLEAPSSASRVSNDDLNSTSRMDSKMPSSRLPLRSQTYTVNGADGDGLKGDESGVDEGPIYMDQVRRMWESNRG